MLCFFSNQKIVGAIKSLESLGDVVKTETKSVKKFELTKEGDEVAKRGSHESLVFANVPADGIAQPELMKLLANNLGAAAKVGFSKAMSSGWLAIDKSGGEPRVVRKVAAIDDDVQKQLAVIASGQVSILRIFFLRHLTKNMNLNSKHCTTITPMIKYKHCSTKGCK
jgi:phenylalanyl-tRNA synthetase alpha chain